MDNAKSIPCDVLYKPENIKFSEKIRMFQGCPTLAVTKGGRIYLGWYSGGTIEPHMENYNLLIYSDDKGETWSEPLIVIPSSCERLVHALDIQLFTDPDGKLHVCWVQNNTLPEPEIKPDSKPSQPLVARDGYLFGDFRHAEWEIVCDNPDADEPVFSQPRFLFPGFLRCKPTFLKNGNILYFNYDQLSSRYACSLSEDSGKTFERIYGSEKIATQFDEAMAYETEDGCIRMFARCSAGQLAESISTNGGRTWSDAKLSGITAADTRFYVEKLPSGRVLLIYNDFPNIRKNMTVALSEDDGKTWKYKKCIDTRENISYPDAAYFDGVIYLSYDRGRCTDREILFASFTEQDIIEGNDIDIKIISKPPQSPAKKDVTEAIEREKIIAIVRGLPKEKLIKTAEAMYAGGIRLMEITYKKGGEDSETAECIKMLSEHFKGRMLIGAGTVITKNQVRLTKMAGGCFIISPNTDKDIIAETRYCGMVSIPGALTPTEVSEADAAGADFVKLFPISTFGAEYVKAIKAPLSDIKLLAVGGIDENNIKDYLAAGVVGFGIGSNIIKKSLVDADDYVGITALAEKYVSALK